MPPDDIDRRLRDVENKVYSFEQSFGRIAEDIHDIKENIHEFIEVKSKLGAIDVLFKRVDDLRKDIQNLDRSMTPIVTEHTACIKKRETVDLNLLSMNARLTKLEFEHQNCSRLKEGTIHFLSGRFGNLFDWVLKVGLGALLVYAAQHSVKSGP